MLSYPRHTMKLGAVVSSQQGALGTVKHILLVICMNSRAPNGTGSKPINTLQLGPCRRCRASANYHNQQGCSLKIKAEGEPAGD